MKICIRASNFTQRIATSWLGAGSFRPFSEVTELFKKISFFWIYKVVRNPARREAIFWESVLHGYDKSLRKGCRKGCHGRKRTRALSSAHLNVRLPGISDYRSASDPKMRSQGAQDERSPPQCRARPPATGAQRTRGHRPAPQSGGICGCLHRGPFSPEELV